MTAWRVRGRAFDSFEQIAPARSRSMSQNARPQPWRRRCSWL